MIVHLSQTTYSTSHQVRPVSKVHGANMGLIWGRQDPGGPHVGPMNFIIWAHRVLLCTILVCVYHLVVVELYDIYLPYLSVFILPHRVDRTIAPVVMKDFRMMKIRLTVVKPHTKIKCDPSAYFSGWTDFFVEFTRWDGSTLYRNYVCFRLNQIIYHSTYVQYYILKLPLIVKFKW